MNSAPVLDPHTWLHLHHLGTVPIKTFDVALPAVSEKEGEESKRAREKRARESTRLEAKQSADAS